MRNNPERSIESSTDHSSLRYYFRLHMSHQGTLADALVIQAVADALNLNFELKFTSSLNKQPVNSILSTSLVILDLSKRLSKSHFKSYQL